jgi:hypothetical protein
VAEVKNQRIGVAGSQSGFPKKPFSPLMSTCAVSSKHKDAEHRPLVVWIAVALVGRHRLIAVFTSLLIVYF